MSHALKFTGPFIKRFYATATVSGNVISELGGIVAFARQPENPAYESGKSTWDQFKPHVRRIMLIIQYTGATPTGLYLEGNLGNYLTILPNQTITFENYNGGFAFLGDGSNITVWEAFA